MVYVHVYVRSSYLYIRTLLLCMYVCTVHCTCSISTVATHSTTQKYIRTCTDIFLTPTVHVYDIRMYIVLVSS